MGEVYLRTDKWTVSNEYCVIVSDGTNPIRVPAGNRSELCARVHSILGLPAKQDVIFTAEDVLRAGNEHYTVHHYLVAREH